jgi:hypothetical protein
VISAKLTKELEEKYQQLGVAKILSKPVESNDFINAMNELIV